MKTLLTLTAAIALSIGLAGTASATSPDAKAPSSFELPMNTEFTADTRPSISGGVRS